jgi:hypothetical protein
MSPCLSVRYVRPLLKNTPWVCQRKRILARDA